jgi:hypothetical protein
MLADPYELNIPRLLPRETDLSLERLGKLVALQSRHDKFCLGWTSSGSNVASPSETSLIVSSRILRKDAAPGWDCCISVCVYKVVGIRAAALSTGKHDLSQIGILLGNMWRCNLVVAGDNPATRPCCLFRTQIEMGKQVSVFGTDLRGNVVVWCL